METQLYLKKIQKAHLFSCNTCDHNPICRQIRNTYFCRMGYMEVKDISRYMDINNDCKRLLWGKNESSKTTPVKGTPIGDFLHFFVWLSDNNFL